MAVFGVREMQCGKELCGRNVDEAVIDGVVPGHLTGT